MSKFPEVKAKMTRLKDKSGELIKDEKNNCILVRNDTKILFDNSNNHIGTVIMSNPGSFKFDISMSINDWNNFISGYSPADTMAGEGKPDSTMRNIIKAVSKAYNEVYKKDPAGYIEVYNLSSVVNPDSKKAIEYHNKAYEVYYVKDNSNVIIDPVIKDQQCFYDLCARSNFVILGFVSSFLNNEAIKIINWSKMYNYKIIYAKSIAKSWPTHPYIWFMKEKYGDLISEKLANVI